MSVSGKLAWRYLIGRPGRTLLTTLAITLGVLFAGVYSAALTAFIERLLFIINFVGLG